MKLPAMPCFPARRGLICVVWLAAALLISAVAWTQRADRWHRKMLVADTHNDVISQVTLKGLDMTGDLSGKAHTDLDRLRAGGVGAQVFSIFCDERYGPGTAFAMALRQMDSLQDIVRRHPDKLMLAGNYKDIRKVTRSGRIACLMGVEGGHMIESRLDYLDSLRQRGARYMTLTWNNSTPWASSAMDEEQGTVPPRLPGRGFQVADRGLDSFGVAVVRRMQATGIIVDISHVGEATFNDVMRIAAKPVMASHSSVHAICPHRRNLKDDQLRAIARNGGVVFVNFYSGFLDSGYEARKRDFIQKHRPTRDSLRQLNYTSYEVDMQLARLFPEDAANLRPPLRVLIDHIDHIVRVAGINHVGLGSDFDGIESAPQGLDSVADFPAITRALAQRGYTKKDIRKILGGNFLRLLRANQAASLQ